MHFHKRKLNLGALAFAALVGFSAYASEKKEEGGGGHEGGDKKEASMPKDQKEFNEKSQKLNSLTTRIEEAEKQFNDLVHHKSIEKDKSEQERIIKEMNEVVKTRNKLADEYTKIKSDLTLRYPNQGQQLNRRYQTQTKKSMEELEGVAGLDELLTRTKKIVEKKFAPFQPVEVQRPKPKIAQPEDEKPARLRLEK